MNLKSNIVVQTALSTEIRWYTFGLFMGVGAAIVGTRLAGPTMICATPNQIDAILKNRELALFGKSLFGTFGMKVQD